MEIEKLIVWLNANSEGSRAPAKEAAEILNRLDDWSKLSDGGLRLMCGEMTAQEIRTVRGVLSVIKGRH